MVDENTKAVYEEAQKGLISSLLCFPGQIKNVRGLVHPEDLDDGSSRVLYKTILELDEKNMTPDYPNVMLELQSSGRIIEAGGPSNVTSLFNEGTSRPLMGTIESYAQIIKNVSAKIRLSKVTDEMHQQAEDPHGSAIDVIESGKRKIDNVLLGLATSNGAIKVSEYYNGGYMDALKQKIKIYEETGGDPLAAQKGIPSSFDTLNENTGGWLPGQFNVVGARTGVGKSFFLVNEAVKACSTGRSVLFFSLEMLRDELLDRIVSCYSQYFEGQKPVRLSGLKKGSLGEDEMKTLQMENDGTGTPGTDNRVPGFSEFKLEIDTTPNISVDHIRAKAQQLKTSQTGLDMIIVDYLQLIQPPTGDMNRERQVAEISRGLKLLSMQLEVPILVAVQLNRLHKGDDDPMPTTDDIRESNAIAQDASVIVLIHRDTKKNGQGGYDPSTFILGKNRNGNAGIRFKCKTALNYAAFLEMSDDLDEINDDEEESGNLETDDPTTSGPTMGDFDNGNVISEINGSPEASDDGYGDYDSEEFDDDEEW